MRTKWLLTLSIVSGVLHAEDRLQFHCFEPSRFFNGASLVQTETSFEVGIKGGSLGDTYFSDLSGIPIRFEELSHSRIFISFTKDECSISYDRNTVFCEKKIDPPQKIKFFVEQSMSDIRKDLIAITPVEAESVRVNFVYGQTFDAYFKGARRVRDRHLDTQRIHIPTRELHFPMICDHEPRHLNNALFPERLKKFLKTGL